jgi:small subunit ribosomal protein S3
LSSVKNVIKDNYNAMLINDFLRKKIKDSGFSNVEISKNPTGTRVTLYVTRPGIVIGRKGSGIKELTELLEKKFGLKNPQIAVEEIQKPELSPNVMCNRMASHLERGTAFRRATMWTMQQIMENGAMGTQITISGKLRGDRSAFEKHSAGILPRAGHHADVVVSEDIVHVETAMGLIGVRIRIAIKEKLIPEFELKGKSKEMLAKEAQVKQDEDELAAKAETESELIVLEEEKIKEIVSMEEEEEELK